MKVISNIGNEVEVKEFSGMEKFIFDDNGVIVGLTDEEKTRLANLVIEHFDWCGCYEECNFNVVKNDIIGTWFDNKKNILNKMVKHPNYNGDYAIEFHKGVYRKIDKDVCKRFLNSAYYFAYKMMSNHPYIYEGTDYLSVCQERMGISNDLDHAKALLTKVPSLESLVVEWDNKYEELSNLRAKFREMRSNGDLATYDNQYYDWETYKKFENIADIFSYISDGHLAQFVDDNLESLINNKLPDFKAKAGQKMSRVVNKLCKMSEIDKITWNWLFENNYSIYEDVNLEEHGNDNAYNVRFAKFADAINPFEIDKHFFISIHPVEAYLAMSWGTTWSSCHTTDKENKHDWSSSSGASYRGCYSSGTMSYMLDNSSVTMYILGDNAVKEAEEKGEPSPRKEMRQMFHIGKEKFIQGRLYPYDQTDKGFNAEPSEYVQYREIMQNVISEIYELPNLWTNKRGTNYTSDYVDDEGTHYRDYSHYENCNISFIKDSEDTSLIYIGHDPICPKCGGYHDGEDNCFCEDCRDGKTEFYCEYHEQYEREYDEDIIDVEGLGTCCRRAVEYNSDIHYCEHCNNYFYDDNRGNAVRSDADGIDFCCVDCANASGYYYIERYEDYLHEDEVAWSEIDHEDLWEEDDDTVDAIYNEWGDRTIALYDSCEEYNGRYYDRDIMVEDENGYYIPEWKAVEVYVDENNTEIWNIDDVEDSDEYIEIDGEWYLESACVETEDGELVPEWYTVKIGDKIYNEDDCVHLESGWQLKENCIVYNGEYYLRKNTVMVDGVWVPINMSEMEELDKITLEMVA